MQPDPTSSSPGEYRVAQVCDQFERLWQSGQIPRIEDYLPQVAEGSRPLLLRELLRTELELSRSAGQTPQSSDYEQRFSDHGSLVQELFSETVGMRPQAGDADTASLLLAGEETGSLSPSQSAPAPNVPAPTGASGTTFAMIGR